MPDTDVSKGQMPDAETVAIEAITHLASRGYHSQVMALDRELLETVARKLVTPGVVRADVLRWLNSQQRAAIQEMAFYRFCRRFEETWQVVWGEFTAALAKARADRRNAALASTD